MTPERIIDRAPKLIHRAILGSDPGYVFIDEMTSRRLGRYVGGFVDRWEWDRAAVMRMNQEEAAEVYAILNEGDL